MKLGSHHSEDTKKKMSIKKQGQGLGRKLPPFTDEHRANISASRKGKPSYI